MYIVKMYNNDGGVLELIYKLTVIFFLLFRELPNKFHSNEKKIKYEFNNSLGILFKTYYGPITIEDILSSWEYAFENQLIPKNKKGFILDYRDSNLNIKINEYTAISDFYKKHIEIFGNYKIAVISENPRDIVVPILVETKDDGYISRPFSTLEAAINWVLS